MKYGIIDIGSNSVRLMVSVDDKCLYKIVQTTRLGQGMSSDNLLQQDAIDRTVSAVCSFYNKAKDDGAEKIYAFATAAFRTANNSNLFLEKVFDCCWLKIDVVSGQKEAELGVLGALGYNDGGLIDIGGASTEIVVIKDKQTVYKNSINVGAVSLKDACGQDKDKINEYLDVFANEIKSIPSSTFVSIGGTATSLASIMQELEPYDPTKTHGYKINRSELIKTVDKLFKLSVEQKKKLKGLQPERAEIIAGGAYILSFLMDNLGVDVVTVSESDNLEGYLLDLRRKYEKEN